MTRPELTDAERTRRKANVWQWISRGVLALLILLALLMVAYLMIANLALRGQLNDAYDARDQAYVQRDEAIANWKALFEQVEAIPGEEPVVEAPTAEASESSTPGPQGQQGQQGDPGRAPTVGEVRAGVLAVCSDFTTLCLGPSGPSGPNGTPGLDGAAGQPGESITGPTGPAGATGPQGEPGAQGPQGPAGTDGQSAFPFVFMFTFGVTTYTCTVTTPTESVCAPALTEPTP